MNRLRRVRAYTKLFPSNDELKDSEDIDLDNMIMLGDSVCGKIVLKEKGTSLCFGKITSIRNLTDKKFSTVSPVTKQGELQFQVYVYSGEVRNGILLLKDDKVSNVMTWKGSHCLLVEQKEMSLEMDNAISIIGSLPVMNASEFNSSFFLSYHTLWEHNTNENKDVNSVTCRLCCEEVPIKQMRTHVGKHILKEQLGDVCGFCGMVGCSIDLIKGSGRGSSVTSTAGSNCSYKCKFSLKAAEKPTKSGPCTNRPIRCDMCCGQVEIFITETF